MMISSLSRGPAMPGFSKPVAVHDPRREIRAGAAIIGVFVLGFLGWSAVARLDSAVHTPGVVRVAGNRQAIQSPTGGVISAIHVSEGDRVRAGQLLVEFATSDAIAQERSLASRVFGLQAEIARINSEREGRSQVDEPAEWAVLSEADRVLARRALAGESSNLAAQGRMLTSQRAVMKQRIAQISDQIQASRQRQASNVRQDALNTDELKSVQQLYEKGFATRSRVLALQRSAASIQGDIGATAAEEARLHNSGGETQMEMLQLTDQRQRDLTERQRAAQTELDSLLPQWKAARDQLARTQLRAPVSGTIIALAANTVGGVAGPGQKLMEIVPTDNELVVETQVAPSDAGDLHSGQRADIRLSSLRGRTPPLLHGVVKRVSADSMIDEHSGKAYYAATVAVSRQALDQVGRDMGIVDAIRPGTPVEVIVPLKSRTALQFWISPLREKLSPALSER